MVNKGLKTATLHSSGAARFAMAKACDNDETDEVL